MILHSVILLSLQWNVFPQQLIEAVYMYGIVLCRVMLYGPVTVGPHKYRNICWLAESKHAANHQMWVHLWGPCVTGPYNIMAVIKISKKRILIGRIYHFRRCQIILWWNEMELFDRAWFGCCPSGRIPSDDYGIPTCSSNDVTCSSALGLPNQQVVENKCELMHKTE